MKRLQFLLGAVAILSVFFFSGLSSCKKEEIVQNNINVTDTLYLEKPITTAMLCLENLMYEEIRGVRGGAVLYYLRGGSSNTENLDNEYIKFNADNTGEYHENGGIVRNITWAFANTNNTKLNIFFTNTPANFTVTWDNIRYKDNKWYFDEYYKDGNTGAYSHSQNIRLKKP